MIQELLTEKLRPKELKHIILPKRIKQSFINDLQQNVILYGSPGTGKTSMAKILMKNYPHLFINVSDESSVDIIRTKINDFCSTTSIIDNKNYMKIVVLDEFDGASEQFYKALRGTIEKYNKKTRFIATCNYINKIPDAIKSRFEAYNFDPINKEEEYEIKLEWEKRISKILDLLKINYTNEILKIFITKHFPDMRSVLNTIQRWSINKLSNLTEEIINKSFYDYEELFEMIFSKPNPIKNYSFIVGQYSSRVDEVMFTLGKDLIDWIKEKKTQYINFIPGILITVAKYQAERNLVIDPVISLLALVFSIQQMVNNKN